MLSPRPSRRRCRHSLGRRSHQSRRTHRSKSAHPAPSRRVGLFNPESRLCAVGYASPQRKSAGGDRVALRLARRRALAEVKAGLVRQRRSMTAVQEPAACSEYRRTRDHSWPRASTFVCRSSRPIHTRSRGRRMVSQVARDRLMNRIPVTAGPRIEYGSAAHAPRYR